MNIGFVGAENSHTLAVATILNVQRAIRGARATHLWGETKAFATRAAEKGQIPNIVSNPADMIGEVDGVMIDHRDGKFHYDVAKRFLKAGVPVFVDKPMTTSLAQAKQLLKLRSECKTPLCTLSAIPYLPNMKDIRRQLKKIGKLRSVRMYGPGDFRSKYGGIWFYGIHQAATLTDLLGSEMQSASMFISGNDSVATISYGDGLTASMHLMVDGPYTFRISAIGHDGAFEAPIPFSPDVFKATTRVFTKMFRTGVEPFADREMLGPLAILDALERSLQTRKTAKIRKF